METHPCDWCGTDTPADQLRPVDDEQDGDELWVCPPCFPNCTLTLIILATVPEPLDV